MSATNNTIKGLYWSFVEKIGAQGVQFIVGLFLARILFPEDYGLIGMLMIFIAISGAIIDGGLPIALIRKKNSSDTDYSTVFWYNLFISIVLFIIFFFSSKYIAIFYEKEILEDILKIMSLVFIINAAGSVQKTVFTINLNFKIQAKISIVAVIVSGTVGVMLAYYNFGVWALVAQTVVSAIVTNISLWLFSFWKPKFVFSIASFKELFGFGYKLLLATILNKVFENIYAILIGKYFSAKDLGFYTRAESLQLLPVNNVYSVIQKVAFPVISKYSNIIDITNAFRKFLRLTMAILFPIMFLMLVTAYSLILIVLTEKWLPSVSLLQLFCITGVLYPIHAINLNVLNVMGRSDIFLKLEFIKKGFIVIAILSTFSYGVKALVIGQIVFSAIALILNTYYTKKLISYGIFAQLKDIFPFFISALISSFIVYLISLFIINHLIIIAINVVLGTIFYFVFLFIFQIEEIKYLYQIEAIAKIKRIFFRKK